MNYIEAHYNRQMESRIITWLFILVTIATTAFCFAASSELRGDGRIRLYNYHLDEFGEFEFRKNGELQPEVLTQIHRLLRSRDNHTSAVIDSALIDRIDHLQDHFQADTIEIISAYRSQELNQKLRADGHAVSPVSLHTKGQALDIHIDEVREETVRDYLLRLKQGGVGYYGPLDFIHIDMGPSRQWGENQPFKRKLVGVLQPKAPLQLTSDQNDYLPGSTLHFKWSSQEKDLSQQAQKLRLEHFHRGQWQPVSSKAPPTSPAGFHLPYGQGPLQKPDGTPRYGKYRWLFKLPGNPAPLSSNEFYLKQS